MIFAAGGRARPHSPPQPHWSRCPPPPAPTLRCGRRGASGSARAVVCERCRVRFVTTGSYRLCASNTKKAGATQRVFLPASGGTARPHRHKSAILLAIDAPAEGESGRQQCHSAAKRLTAGAGAKDLEREGRLRGKRTGGSNPCSGRWPSPGGIPTVRHVNPRPRRPALDAIATRVDAAQGCPALQRLIPRVDCGCMGDSAIAAVAIVARDRVVEAQKDVPKRLRSGIIDLVRVRPHHHRWWQVPDDDPWAGGHIRPKAQQRSISLKAKVRQGSRK